MESRAVWVCRAVDSTRKRMGFCPSTILFDEATLKSLSVELNRGEARSASISGCRGTCSTPELFLCVLEGDVLFFWLMAERMALRIMFFLCFFVKVSFCLFSSGMMLVADRYFMLKRSPCLRDTSRS